MSQFVIVVMYSIEPEHAATFHVAVQQQAQHSLSREEGCLQFDVCSLPNAPEQVLLYEVYSDAAAFEAHRQTEHFQHFSTTIEPWIKSKTVTAWQRLS